MNPQHAITNRWLTCNDHLVDTDRDQLPCVTVIEARVHRPDLHELAFLQLQRICFIDAALGLEEIRVENRPDRFLVRESLGHAVLLLLLGHCVRESLHISERPRELSLINGILLLQSRPQKLALADRPVEGPDPMDIHQRRVRPVQEEASPICEQLVLHGVEVHARVSQVLRTAFLERVSVEILARHLQPVLAPRFVLEDVRVRGDEPGRPPEGPAVDQPGLEDVFQPPFERVLRSDPVRREQLLQFIDDQPRVAIDVPANRQDRDPSIFDAQLLEHRAWQSVERRAVEVFQAAECEVPIHLPSEDGRLVCEEYYWWVLCHIDGSANLFFYFPQFRYSNPSSRISREFDVISYAR